MATIARMIRESVRTALVFVLIAVCACSDDDDTNADEGIPPTTLVAMSELHMNGALSYDFCSALMQCGNG
jgi:hypothetical protein